MTEERPRLPKSKMKLHPFDEVVANADSKIKLGATVHQQWNCEHCGVKQTMEEPNRFFTSGICEECGKETDIVKNGHNFMLDFKPGQMTADALAEILGGKR